MSRLIYAFPFVVAGLASGCATRTAAATQTTIAAFDATKSDAKAIELADQVATALGGADTWTKTKEVVWSQGIIVDGKLIDFCTHAWDRWEGRHQYSRLDPMGQHGVTMHELFGSQKYAYVEGEKGRAQQLKEDTEKMAAEAKKRLDLDSYRIFLAYKLKDPGVKIKFSEERPAEGTTDANAPMIVDVIQITFEPGVGPDPGDTYYLVIDKKTHLPLQIEHVPTGRKDEERSAYRIDGWQDSGGLKFPTKFTNIGYTRPDAPTVPLAIPKAWAEMVPLKPTPVQSPGEFVVVTSIKASTSVNDDLYVPDVKTLQ